MLREGEQEEHYLQFNLTHDVSPIRSHNAEIMDHLMFTDGSQQVKEFLMLWAHLLPHGRRSAPAAAEEFTVDVNT